MNSVNEGLAQLRAAFPHWETMEDSTVEDIYCSFCNDIYSAGWLDNPKDYVDRLRVWLMTGRESIDCKHHWDGKTFCPYCALIKGAHEQPHHKIIKILAFAAKEGIEIDEMSLSPECFDALMSGLGRSPAASTRLHGPMGIVRINRYVAI